MQFNRPIIATWILSIATQVGLTGADESNLQFQQYQLEHSKIRESSGVAMSARHRGILWTHNDSGNKEQLFAFSRTGKHRAEVKVSGVKNEDWEDIATYQAAGRGQIMIGDVGDNALRRKHVYLYRFNEPDLDDPKIKVDQVWEVSYRDHPRNSEAIAVDATEGCILIASKVRPGNQAEIFRVPLDISDQKVRVRASRVATIDVPMITGMDVHPRNGNIVIVTYDDAYLYTPRVSNDGKRDWQATFRQARRLILPKRRQGEAIAFDNEMSAVWLTSEKYPAHLFHVPIPSTLTD